MKKILLTLACSFLLAGCLAQPAEEKEDPKGDNTPSQSEPAEPGDNTPSEGENSEDGGENEDPSGTDEEPGEGGSTNPEPDGDQDEGGQDPEPSTEELKTKTVSFLNGGFTSSSLDKAASQENFIKWFNGIDDLLTSINYSGYCQMNWIGNEKDSWRFSTLILGSSSQDGQIKFNFAHNIKSVKLNIQGYCKYIAYSDSYSVDTDAKFYLDSDLYDLSVSAGYTGELEKKDVTKSYTSDTTSLTIKNLDGRVFVHSMEISYIA